MATTNPPFESRLELLLPWFDRSFHTRLGDELKRVQAEAAPPPSGVNLVMGMATSYQTAQIAPFVLSLRQGGYTGDIVLLVTEVDPDTRRFMEENRVDIEYFWDSQFIPADKQLSRFFCYYRVLRSLAQRGRTYDRVLLSDVRDVVFQSDPFAQAPMADILTFLEHPSKIMGECAINSFWIEHGFGQPLLDKIADRRISCSGTVMGTGKGILAYLLVMQMGTFECKPAARMQIVGVDQGIHNVLVARHNLPAEENGRTIWTVGCVPPEDIVVDAAGVIRDHQGHAPAVIHQYDRHGPLAELVARRWGK
jgi:hypothetical protein